jgi:ribosomal protein S18 acetylase RimI-like enzyme
MRIAVSENVQGKGVGSFLMDCFIESLKDRVKGLRLGVNPRNTRAIRLYEKFGFIRYAAGAGGYLQMKLDLK